MRGLKLFAKDRNGATGVEYALLVSLIAMVIVGSFANYSGVLGNMFGTISNTYEAAAH